MKPLMTMRQALEDKTLLGSAFARPAAKGIWPFRKEPVDTWLTWEALSIAMAGETLTPEEREPFCAVTGREPPGAQIAQLIHMEIQRYFETDRQSNLTKEEANHIERTLMAMPEDKQNPRPRKKKFMIA